MKYLVLSILLGSIALESQVSVVKQYDLKETQTVELEGTSLAQEDASLAVAPTNADTEIAIAPYNRYYTNRLYETRSVLSKVVDSVIKTKLLSRKQTEQSLWNKIYRALLPEFTQITLSTYAYYSTDQMVKKITQILDSKVILLQILLTGNAASSIVGKSIQTFVATSVNELYVKYAQLARDYLKEEIEGLEDVLGVTKINEWNVLVTAKVLGMPMKTLKRYEREEKKGEEIGLTYEIENFASQEMLLPSTKRELSFLI